MIIFRSPSGVKFDGNLELEAFLQAKTPANKARGSASAQLPRRNNSAYATTNLQNAENVVQEQQKGLYRLGL